ncbi:hypothetical protein PtA15_5A299 [Puccinia triticina]|uniref:Uncharacterized protein n=1 Tax=Puccinia triticina TaxID=208348 RepID=A0ABY7CHL6_9BASI|nr:uncharacterized protein PtA15_5A299 [Puccinia triticina]WAQ84726.1 hypothetical protein PtA15_5A299 [Puccinia triticina]
MADPTAPNPSAGSSTKKEDSPKSSFSSTDKFFKKMIQRQTVKKSASSRCGPDGTYGTPIPQEGQTRNPSSWPHKPSEDQYSRCTTFLRPGSRS